MYENDPLNEAADNDTACEEPAEVTVTVDEDASVVDADAVTEASADLDAEAAGEKESDSESDADGEIEDESDADMSGLELDLSSISEDAPEDSDGGTEADVEAEKDREAERVALSAGALFEDTVSLIENGGVDLDSAIMLLKKAAGDGCVEAWLYLGKLYSDESGAHYNQAVAFDCFESAAAFESGAGYYHLGRCFVEGFGCDKDIVKALECFEKGRALGDTDCICALGICREFGVGCEIDYTLAAELYAEAAERSHPAATSNLGGCYLYGHGVPQNKEKAFELFQKAAELGCAAAECRLGACRELGDGCERDSAIAFAHYERAAEMGHALSMYRLGFCYDMGIGVEQNFAKAFKHYSSAAAAGYAEAMHEVGMMSKSGRGTKKDPVAAYNMFALAAENGFPDSEYELGNCYFEGVGTVRNREFAFSRYMNAFKNGKRNADAAFKIGLCKLKGFGTDKNEAEAFEWFCKGTELGSCSAAYMKGECFFYGIGIQQEQSVAVACYEKAISLSDDVNEKASALFALAHSLENGYGAAKNLPRALKLYRQAAESDDPVALYHAGRALMLGFGDRPNLALAREYILAAARHGHVSAMLSLGIFADEGRGIPQNYKDATIWYNRALDAEMDKAPGLYEFPERFSERLAMDSEARVEAQYRIGMMIARSETSSAAYMKAFEYIASAASLSHEEAGFEVARFHSHGGDLKHYFDSLSFRDGEIFERIVPSKDTIGKAMNRLGDAYFDGKTTLVKKNLPAAARCYKISAELGNVEACYSYGWCLRHGVGVRENAVEALKWLKSAADKGNINAAYSYGLCCEEGAGTGIKNKREARSYYRKAAAGGHTDAARRYMALSD